MPYPCDTGRGITIILNQPIKTNDRAEKKKYLKKKYIQHFICNLEKSNFFKLFKFEKAFF
jgi:hypothetical protein